MIRRNSIRSARLKKESVEDPRELLLSLVDLGSITAEEALLACVKEMSDAECKRILNSLSLPSATEEVEDEPEEALVEVPEDDEVVELDKEDLDDEDDMDSLEDEDEVVVPESLRRRRLERRIRQLENRLRHNRR